MYTGCPRRNVKYFGRVFLMLNYTDITQNTYIQSWTVTELIAIEKWGLLWCPRTVRRPWRNIHPLRKPGKQISSRFTERRCRQFKQQVIQWCWVVINQIVLNDELETIWMEAEVAKFEGIFRNLPVGIDRNHEIQSGQLVSQPRV